MKEEERRENNKYFSSLFIELLCSRPFSSFFLPLCQSEPKWKTIYADDSRLHGRFRTKNRFQTEALIIIYSSMSCLTGDFDFRILKFSVIWK